MHGRFFSTTFLVSMTVFTSLNAQIPDGVYRMSGGHEMVAAFEFKKDSTFKFYFIYGAVDRNSSGRYSIHDRNIILHALKEPGKDFIITRQEKRGEGTAIKVSDKNPYLIRNVAGIFKKGAEQDQQFSDQDGYMHSNLADCDTIYVIHTLFPDVPTIIKKKEPKNNYFEISLNPSLEAVSFQDFTLSIDPEGLTGSLPWLFERDKAIFVKVSE
jgi:hypothetical protein